MQINLMSSVLNITTPYRHTNTKTNHTHVHMSAHSTHYYWKGFCPFNIEIYGKYFAYFNTLWCFEKITSTRCSKYKSSECKTKYISISDSKYNTYRHAWYLVLNVDGHKYIIYIFLEWWQKGELSCKDNVCNENLYTDSIWISRAK